jgi:L-ascorbate metabolism protein UlaG (beta-lactamase superfamily)
LLTPDDLEELGRIDVLIVSADGSWSISHEDALHIIEQVKAPLVVPTHYVSEGVLARFLARAGDRWPVKRQGAAHVTLTRDRLPANTEILILEGY